MGEYFIRAYSGAAPFISDESTKYVEAADPVAALVQFAVDYSHPCGLFSANVYTSADAFHKGKPAVHEWRSPEAKHQSVNDAEGETDERR